MFDLDDEMERMQKMLDRRERMALGVTCTEMIELITRLSEAEIDAARYRWLRDVGQNKYYVDDILGCILRGADGSVDYHMNRSDDE